MQLGMIGLGRMGANMVRCLQRNRHACVLAANTPVREYEPGTWGPDGAEHLAPPGGWANPMIEEGASAYD